MRRDERRFEPLHEGGKCSESDVMVVRGIHVPDARPVRHALKSLKHDTSGLIVPYSVGEIPLPIFGGTLLKSLVAAEKAKRKKQKKLVSRSTIPTHRLDDVNAQMSDMCETGSLTLEVASPERPFYVNDHDQIVVEFEDTNPQLDEDRDSILRAMECLLGNHGDDANETVTYFRPPEIVLGLVQPFMLDKGQSYTDFRADPNDIIRQRVNDARDLRGEPPIDGPIFPKTVTFDGLRVVARRRTPAHMYTVRQEMPNSGVLMDLLESENLAEAS